MLKLLKNTECYAPEYLGRQDILVAFGKIMEISPGIPTDRQYIEEIIDCEDRLACPGFVDQHVHISGGGGEGGPGSIIGPLDAYSLFSSGVTTVIGLLGADAVSKSMAGLLMKARSLEYEGITSYIYSGNYGVPPVTITGSLLTDLALVDKVIGAGEIALSDHRSSYPSLSELIKLSYETLTGGMLGHKAGVIHFHLGNGKEGLRPLVELVEKSDFPISMFVPTHLNRNRELFRQAVQYWSGGGNLDLTAGEESEAGHAVPDCLERLLRDDQFLNRVTISSDGNGSGAGASGNETAKVRTLFDDFRSSVLDHKIPVESVLRTITANPASVLKLYPGKGRLAAGSDADILLLDRRSLRLDKVMAGGRLVFEDGTPLKDRGGGYV